MEKSVSVTKLHSFFQLFDDYNFNKEAIAKSLSITLKEFNSPDFRVSISNINAIFNIADKIAEDTLYGLKYGLNLYKSFSSVLGVLLTSCKDINEVLDNFCKYEKILDNTIITSYKFIDENLSINMAFTDLNRKLPEHYVEYKISGFIAYVRNLIGDSKLSPLNVNFTHSPLTDKLKYEKLLGCPVSFDQKELNIIYPKSILKTLTVEPNSILKRLMIDEAQNELAKIENISTYVSKVQVLLSNSSGVKLPTLYEISKGLNVSERLLQKHLKDEGYTFTSIITDYKKETAKKYLKNPMNTVDEIAFILGFSERSSFDRAFKKWTSCTPIEYRSNSRTTL